MKIFPSPSPFPCLSMCLPTGRMEETVGVAEARMVEIVEAKLKTIAVSPLAWKEAL